MAPSPFSKKFYYHSRSNSMPSKPHPLIMECNEHLSRLEGSETICSSSSSISHKLSCLEDLHDSVENLFQLPLIQQVIAQESQEHWVEELLDGSLRLLDACTAAKDAIMHTKECARELQSTIRRRRCGAVEFEAEVKKYLSSRKFVRKAICKALKSLCIPENKCSSSPANNSHESTVSLIDLAREMEKLTLSVLESLLSFISGPVQSKAGSWSLVSKLIHSKRVACTQEIDENVFLKVDASLQYSILEMKSKTENTNDLSCQLEQLESCTQDLEDGLEKMFKKLIKIRVSLLNIINH